jgi:hypothetical protein
MSKIEKLCECCGESFMANSKELNRGNAKYCSLSCAGKMPKKLQYKQICKHCGVEFNSASKNAKYCSNSCKQKNYRLKQKDVSKEGRSIKHFYKIFENTPCELCGWDKTSRDLHHIIKVSNGGLTTLKNLLCLCPNCHRMIHDNPISEDDLNKIIKTRTISSS